MSKYIQPQIEIKRVRILNIVKKRKKHLIFITLIWQLIELISIRSLKSLFQMNFSHIFSDKYMLNQYWWILVRAFQFGMMILSIRIISQTCSSLKRTIIFLEKIPLKITRMKTTVKPYELSSTADFKLLKISLPDSTLKH